MAKLPNIIEKERSVWKIIGFVFRESIVGSKKYSIIRVVSSMIGAIFLFAQFGAAGIIVNEFVTNGIDGARTIVLLKGFVLLILSEIVPAIVSIINTYAWNIQGNDISRHLQSLFFKKMEYLDIGTIEQPELQNMYGISNARGWSSFYNINNTLTDCVKQFTALIVAGISIFVISPFVLVIIFIGALPTYFFEKNSAKISAKIHKDNFEEWRMWTVKTNALQQKDAMTELKNFGLVNVFKKKFLVLIERFHHKLSEMYSKKTRNDMIGELILSVSFIIAFYLLIQDVRTGVLAVGSLVFAFGVVARFQGSINVIFSNFGKMNEHKKNVDIILDFLETETLVQSGTRSITPDEFEKITINNLSFKYPGSDKLVLNSVSLEIRRGHNIAIVGLNGAGKSTFLKLITRVYDPTEGEIFVNDINLKEYDLESWKKCLGILLQEYELYSEETIAENIMLGDVSKHDQGLVEKSAIESTAYDFIKDLPMAFEQKVGTEFHGGIELSKGQKQKVVLARVLYRNAPIIILDEPTASVDALSEDVIFKAIKENHKHQARIIISHKFSNVRDADQIILIEHGSILEQGSHDKLMKIKNGKYKELFELQAEGYK
jgi:ABC-type multidrug transport system fused ATPase/permease subunit